MMGAAPPGGEGSEHKLRKSWAANADAWTCAVREGQIPSRLAGTDDAILDAVSALPRGHMLDVGCGEGWLARELGGRGWDVVGVDGSAELIRRAEELGGATFRVLSYEEIARDPTSLERPFDAVICNFSLLGESVAPLLRALGSALAPNGRLLIQTVHPFTACGEEPYRDGWRTETFRGFACHFVEPMPWFFRTMGSWFAEIRRAGLEIAEVREPLDSGTGRPLSLLLVLTNRG